MSGARRSLRWLNAGMAGLFLVAAAVQYDDPDPLGWVAIYVAAAAACLAAWRERTTFLLPTAIGAVALVWAASLAPDVIGAVRFAELLAGDAVAERAREMLGLALVAAWMALLAVLRPSAR